MARYESAKVAFKNGQLIDGNGGTPVQNSLVLVEDGKIAYAGEATEIPQGFEVRDITGKTIMPGIIDAHLHYSGNLTDNDTDWVMEPELQKCVVAVQQAHDCLEHGLTTVGEIGRFGIPIRDMINAGEMLGPRTVATGLGFCATASHGDSHHCSIEMNKASHPWAECVDSPWDLRKAVRRRLRENPDAIKIWATGGGIWRWETQSDQHYAFEEIQAVCDEASLRGIPVWSHCFGDCYPSVKAGCQLIIHGFKIDDRARELMVEKGTYFCPTINFMPDWLTTFPPKYEPELHDQYEGATVKDKEMQRIYDNMRKAAAAGILLTIGSDSFNNQMTPYGYTTIGEIHQFVDAAGISEMDTITAATYNGAKMLGVLDETGTLEAGKAADLLVIPGDPLKDIHAIDCDTMEVIMKDGYLVRG